jgi:hypothetical protein
MLRFRNAWQLVDFAAVARTPICIQNTTAQ